MLETKSNNHYPPCLMRSIENCSHSLPPPGSVVVDPLVCFHLALGDLCLCFCCALLCVLSSFATVLMKNRELVALFLLSYGCLITVNVL